MSWQSFERGPSVVLLWVVFAIIILTALGWVLKPVDKAVEREVLKQSFQYQEGQNQRVAILRANLAQIDADIQRYPEQYDQLIAQRRVIEAQIRAAQLNDKSF